jgi:hypothetical protein
MLHSRTGSFRQHHEYRLIGMQFHGYFGTSVALCAGYGSDLTRYRIPEFNVLATLTPA